MISASKAWRLARRVLIGVALIPVSFAVHAAGKDTVLRTPVEALSIAGQTGRVESGQKFFGDANYAGSDSCKSCHEVQHAEWMDTWHAKMERWPGPDVVIGDFNDRVITYKDVKVKTKDGEEKLSFQVKTHRQGDKFLFTVLDKDNPANDQTFEIAKVLGGKWDQALRNQGRRELPAHPHSLVGGGQGLADLFLSPL